MFSEMSHLDQCDKHGVKSLTEMCEPTRRQTLNMEKVEFIHAGSLRVLTAFRGIKNIGVASA